MFTNFKLLGSECQVIDQCGILPSSMGSTDFYSFLSNVVSKIPALKGSNFVRGETLSDTKKNLILFDRHVKTSIKTLQEFPNTYLYEPKTSLNKTEYRYWFCHMRDRTDSLFSLLDDGNSIITGSQEIWNVKFIKECIGCFLDTWEKPNRKNDDLIYKLSKKIYEDLK